MLTMHSALKGHFSALEIDDDRGISATRGLACELVAWRFLAHLNDREAIDYLLCELPLVSRHNGGMRRESTDTSRQSTTSMPDGATDRTPLLDGSREESIRNTGEVPMIKSTSDDEPGFASNLEGLNALEIAAVTNAKKFLGQKAIQRVINGIWKGDIVFWETLGTHSEKKAIVYNEQRSDPFCRLRVPLYLKVFEVMFFAAFLALYYTVLIARSFEHVTVAEIMLYVWIAAFGHNGIDNLTD